MAVAAMLNFRLKAVCPEQFKILNRNFVCSLKWPFLAISAVEIHNFIKFIRQFWTKKLKDRYMNQIWWYIFDSVMLL